MNGVDRLPPEKWRRRRLLGVDGGRGWLVLDCINDGHSRGRHSISISIILDRERGQRDLQIKNGDYIVYKYTPSVENTFLPDIYLCLNAGI